MNVPAMIPAWLEFTKGLTSLCRDLLHLLYNPGHVG